jgi:hypothetical protein
MMYIKNIATWERVARAVGGIAMILCGLIGLHGLLIGYLVAAVGVVTLLTGWIGYCPACAAIGRRLPPDKI